MEEIIIIIEETTEEIIVTVYESGGIINDAIITNETTWSSSYISSLLGTAPIIQRNKTGSYSYEFDSLTFAEWCFIKKISGTVSVRIGTTAGGDDLGLDTEITSTERFRIEQIFNPGESIYFTITGTVDIRMDVKPELL